jgi:hypothetical protein
MVARKEKEGSAGGRERKEEEEVEEVENFFLTAHNFCPSSFFRYL